MKKLFITNIFLLFFFLETNCQSPVADTFRIHRNAVFIELGGNGLFYTINYDYLVFAKKYFKTALTFGISDHFYAIVPQINFLFGRQVSAEIGCGSNLGLGRKDFPYQGRIGVRYQSFKKFWFFRLAYTPFINYKNHLQNWGGLSIGVTF